MSKADIIRTLNTFFNPFEYHNVHRIPGQGTAAEVATRGASLALGLGTAAALTRSLTRSNDDKKRQAELRSWAGSRFPVISPDTSVEDLEEEIRLRGAGVDPLSKNAAEDEEQEGAAANFFGDLVGGKFSIAEPGVGFLASMGGIYGGYKLADYIADARKKSKMSGDIDQKRNEIDKLIYDEYMRTRGITKDASFTRPTSVDLDRRKGALEQLGQNPIESGSRLAAIGYTTIGMLTLALAYKYSKDYHNKNDPARARIKQLEGVAKRRAMQTQAPLFLEAGSLPDIQAGAKRIAPPKPKAPTRVSTTPGIKTADPTDPLGSILNA